MNELQSHQCMTPEKWTRLLCIGSVKLANKLSLQYLDDYLDLAADVWFSRYFWFLVPNSRGNARFVPPADTHDCIQSARTKNKHF